MTLQMSAHEEELSSVCDRIAATVPHHRGLTVVAAQHGLTVTLMASHEEVAVLDGVQYLHGGPTADVLAHGEPVSCSTAPGAAGSAWPAFARSCAGAGVGSVVVLPVTDDDARVAGAVNVYAAEDSVDLDDLVDDELAALVEGSVPEAMRHAEDAFVERRTSEPGPRSLRGEGVLSRAMGQLAVHLGIDVTAARGRLEDAATRAGVPLERLAASLVHLPL